MIGTDLEFAFLNLCFNNPELWSLDYKPIDPMVQVSFNIVNKFRSRYYKYPNKATFLDYITAQLDGHECKYIKDRLNSSIDEEYIREKIIRFVEKKKLERALLIANELISKDKVAEAKAEVLKGTELVYTRTIDFFKDTLDDVNFIPVNTGFKMFNRVLGGGLNKQNLGLFIGPKSAGKSLTMINLGSNAVLSGENVLHISFEDSEKQIYSRYCKRLEAIDVPHGNLNIHVFPSGGATIADCESLINIYKPGLVLVDYLNEIGSTDKRLNRSEELGDMARGLRGASKRHNCGIWTAQQAGRTAKFSKEDVNAEDAFWSYEPSQVSDVVVTLNQTRDEKEEGKIRFLVDRNRNGADGILLHFDICYANMNLTETEVI